MSSKIKLTLDNFAVKDSNELCDETDQRQMSVNSLKVSFPKCAPEVFSPAATECKLQKINLSPH